MPVIQTNVWACEICRFTAFTVEDVSPFSDPVVTSPPGGEWEYVKNIHYCGGKSAEDIARKL